MKALFLTYLYLEEANGITKKILAQVDALKNWGIDIHLCHFIKREGIRYWAINGEAIDRIGTDRLEAALATNDLLDRKEEILAAPMRER